MILVKKENIEKLRQVMFLALFTFPVVSIKFINIFFICFTIFTLLFYYKEKPKFNFSIFREISSEFLDISRNQIFKKN